LLHEKLKKESTFLQRLSQTFSAKKRAALYNHRNTIRHIISTNNIATGMVRGRRKYAFNPPKVRFRPNTKLPTNATGKSEKTVEQKRKTSLASYSTRPLAVRLRLAYLLQRSGLSGGLWVSHQ
jgi:hypothetical protein